VKETDDKVIVIVPQIIRLEDVKDYMLLGQMILCTEKM
jgi:hypothetical protein